MGIVGRAGGTLAVVGSIVKEIAQLAVLKLYGYFGTKVWHRSKYYQYSVKFGSPAGLSMLKHSARSFGFYIERIPHKVSGNTVDFYVDFENKVDLDMALKESGTSHETSVSTISAAAFDDAMDHARAAYPAGYLMLYYKYKKSSAPVPIRPKREKEKGAGYRGMAFIGGIMAIFGYLIFIDQATAWNLFYLVIGSFGALVVIGAVVYTRNKVGAIHVDFGEEEDVRRLLTLVSVVGNEAIFPYSIKGKKITFMADLSMSANVRSALRSFDPRSYITNEERPTGDEMFDALKPIAEAGRFGQLAGCYQGLLKKMEGEQRDRIRALLLVNGTG